MPVKRIKLDPCIHFIANNYAELVQSNIDILELAKYCMCQSGKPIHQNQPKIHQESEEVDMEY